MSEQNYIGIQLKATNSSGTQTLELVRDDRDGSYNFCLFGEHEGRNLQIDFDDMSAKCLMDIRAMIDLIVTDLESRPTTGGGNDE